MFVFISLLLSCYVVDGLTIGLMDGFESEPTKLDPAPFLLNPEAC